MTQISLGLNSFPYIMSHDLRVHSMQCSGNGYMGVWERTNQLVLTNQAGSSMKGLEDIMLHSFVVYWDYPGHFGVTRTLLSMVISIGTWGLQPVSSDAQRTLFVGNFTGH